jgi:hypothetical protein
MASKKTAPKTAPAKTTDPSNTSAPTAGGNADVSATGAASAAPQVETKSAPPATPTVTTSEAPPAGGNGEAGASFIETAISQAQKARTLIVSAKAEGFRRSGRPWSKNAETVSAADFTPEQIEALMREPMLDVKVVSE